MNSTDNQHQITIKGKTIKDKGVAISLTNLKLDEEDIEKLVKFLPKCSGILRLDLRNSQIKDDQFKKIIQALNTNGASLNLDFSDNQITREGFLNTKEDLEGLLGKPNSNLDLYTSAEHKNKILLDLRKNKGITKQDAIEMMDKVPGITIYADGNDKEMPKNKSSGTNDLTSKPLITQQRLLAASAVICAGISIGLGITAKFNEPKRDGLILGAIAAGTICMISLCLFIKKCTEPDTNLESADAQKKDTTLPQQIEINR